LKTGSERMPGGDRTGPEGRGPLTGRRLGFCSGAGSIGGWFGRGYGRGHGRGLRGFDNYSHPFDRSETERSEVEALKDRIMYLEEELSRTLDRIERSKD
jgi:hypothetical protein